MCSIHAWVISSAWFFGSGAASTLYVSNFITAANEIQDKFTTAFETFVWAIKQVGY